MNTFGLMDKLVKPLKGHGLGDHWPMNVIWQSIEAKLAARQNVIVDVNGYKLHIKGLSGGIATQLLRKQPYEPLTTKILSYLLPTVTDAVDVGANIGYYTLLMSTKVKGYVYAFEPEENNYCALCDNVRLNGCSNVKPLQEAVSDEVGEGELFVSGLESGEHSLVVKRHFVATQSTHVTALDYIQSPAIGLIKTDTEGNDFKVLLGARRLLARRPTTIFLTEFWPEGITKSGYNPKMFWTFLEALFKHIHIIDEMGNEVVKGSFEDAVNRSSKGLSVNLLCANEEVI